MLTPITPARRLAHNIEQRAIEAQLIAKLCDLGEDVIGAIHREDAANFDRRRDELHAVFHAVRAMLGDLVEELGRLEDRALELQEAPSAPQAPPIPAAA